MNRCLAPLGTERLVDFWHGDLTEEAAERVEEHLFACPHCARDLQQLVDLGARIAAAVRAGRVPGLAMTEHCLRKLADERVPTRDYVLAPGEEVACHVTDDVFQIVHLRADFREVERVDLAIRSSDGWSGRFDDVPINRARREVALAWPQEALRGAPDRTVDLRLYAVAPGRERELGRYTLRHSATPPQDRPGDDRA